MPQKILTSPCAWLIISLLVCSVTAEAQSVKIYGTITDEDSQPVAYASVAVKDHQTQLFVGTISDLKGEFSLRLPFSNEDDTLRISSVGFETVLIPLGQLDTNAKQNLKLHYSTTTLQTVLFEDLTAKQLLTECIKKIPFNYRNVTFANDAFYWKAVTQDSTCISFEQSIMAIKEDHSLSRSDRELVYDSITRKGDTLEQLITFDNIENLFYFDFIRTGSGVTNLANLDEWEFEYLNVNTEQLTHATPIKATRKDKLGHFLVYINTDDYSFLRVEFSYQWPSHLHALGNGTLYNLKNVDGIVQYQKTRNKYSIKYLYTTFTYSIFAPHTFKKQFTRTTDFEFTLLSSQELKYHSPTPKTKPRQDLTPVVVNTDRYCKALAFFGGCK